MQKSMKTVKTTVKRTKSATKIKNIKKNGLHLESKHIPMKKLINAQEVLNSPEHPVWSCRKISCMPGIHEHGEKVYTSPPDIMIELALAKQCILRRDWKMIARILSFTDPSAMNICQNLFPLVYKFAAICLAHKEHTKLNPFLQCLLRSAGFDAEYLVNVCSKYESHH